MYAERVMANHTLSIGSVVFYRLYLEYICCARAKERVVDTRPRNAINYPNVWWAIYYPAHWERLDREGRPDDSRTTGAHQLNSAMCEAQLHVLYACLAPHNRHHPLQLPSNFGIMDAVKLQPPSVAGKVYETDM